MDYISLDSYQHYSECAKIVREMGFELIELKISPQRGVVQVQAVVASRSASESIGVNDCARVHRAVLERLEELLGTDNISMELSSPGMERNIRNAAEFAFFIGRRIRVFSREASDWISGTLSSADGEKLSLECADVEGGRTVLYSDIAKAKFVNS